MGHCRTLTLLAGALALLEQGLGMIGIFDVLVAIEAARVPSDAASVRTWDSWMTAAFALGAGQTERPVDSNARPI